MGSHPPILITAATEETLALQAQQRGWRVTETVPADTLDAMQVGLVYAPVFDDVAALRRQYPHAVLIDAVAEGSAADFSLHEGVRVRQVPQLLAFAESFLSRSAKVTELVKDVGLRRRRMHQLNEISMALTGRMSQQELLQTILSEARRIASCEAGSLFLVEQGSDETHALVFKLAQNDVVEFPFVETKLALTRESIAGYVALTGDELNIRDVYTLSADLPYRFNRSFDDRNGYRTRSVLTIAMRDHRDEVVGVLQFINRVNPDSGLIEDFGEENAEVLRAIASQAAVSIQKNALIENINELFESFVQASVKTIEQRDPATSGHSGRVAETTVALLEALPSSGLPAFRNLELSAEHIREVRYAALLHDFGKIGVPENVLVKSHKLSADRLEIIHYRIELQKERLRRRALEQELDLLHHTRLDQDVARRRVHRQLEKQLSMLDDYYDWIQRANKPNVLDKGEFGHLADIRNYRFEEFDGTIGGVINDADLLALSVRRGSLTPDERRQIQDHVVFTQEFLAVLPWPPELASVPEIAGAHHERIDGSGYPRGLVGEQIPLASRVMAVCDVYDALTAMDRPYKPAMSMDAAFAILHEEAERGLLDRDMVEVFLKSGTYKLPEAV